MTGRPWWRLNSINPGRAIADGRDNSVVTAHVADTHGAPVIGEPVQFSVDTGTLSAVKDNGNGTYSVVYTAPTAVGTGVATLVVRDANANVTPAASATVVLTPGPPATAQWVSLSPASLVTDGMSHIDAVLAVADAQQNPVPGLTPVIAVTGALSVSAPMDSSAMGDITC